MAIHFDAERMEGVRKTYTRWWRGELDRPLVRLTLANAYAVEKKSKAPLLSQATCADFTQKPEDIIEALDDYLSTQEYLGDAFPMVNFDAFGPGLLAAFCGAKLDNSSGRVWFFPTEKKEIADIHVQYDPENIWVKRVKAIYRAGLERWNGLVIMGIPDLGEGLDVAAVFRGTENLLVDLITDPDEVLRLCDEIHEAWHAAYNDLAEVLKPQKAVTNWAGFLSDEPSYILQSDFSYMIGNPMFRQFVFDDLKRDTERLTNTMYHLDGIGELNHLEDILSLKRLHSVQWVPGAGNPGPPHWLDVYRRIMAAGKQLMIIGNATDYLSVLGELHGTPYWRGTIQAKDRGLAEQLLQAR